MTHWKLMNLQTFSLPTKLLKLMQSMNLQTPQQLSTLNLFQCLSQIKVSSTKYLRITFHHYSFTSGVTLGWFLNMEFEYVSLRLVDYHLFFFSFSTCLNSSPSVSLSFGCVTKLCCIIGSTNPCRITRK